MTQNDFVHVHVHTEFSLLDGQSKIKDLMQHANDLGQSALAITDHGVMFGVIDFFRAARKANIKPIIGMEAYLAPRGMTDKDPVLDKKPFHMLLLAKNMTGYRNLLKMASAAQLEGYYYRPRIDRDFMAAHAEGVIATSGCLASEIPRMVEQGLDPEARALVGWYQDVFGPENFFLELQNHDIPQLSELNRWIYDYRQSNHTPVQLVATNDVHYVRYDDWKAHDTLLCIQTGAIKSDENRMQLTPYGSYYLKSGEEMRRDFQGAPEWMIDEAFANTLRIADACDVDLVTEGYHLPVFNVPSGFDEQTYLRHLCELGMDWRYGGRKGESVLQERLDRELAIIHDMGFDTYFLIVWDLCEYARHQDIWWNVRGSGAGSLVAYCLGITNIDPILNSLLFERFLNPGRVSMPDIDIDYPDDRRGEMIAYAARKYGDDKVAAIITFGTMGAKAAVRDVGRALNVDLDLINHAASMIPTEARQKKIQEYIDINPDLQRLYRDDDQIRAVMDAAMALQGMTRHASTHAAGLIISDRPLVEYLPLHRITGTDPSGGSLRAVTQFPMETAESIGLLKVDFLGLSTLTIMRKACELIERHHGIRYTMDNIPYRHDDDNITDEQRAMLDDAFRLLGRGETIGVFQVESTGMQQMLRDMRPKVFENIIAAISLYRPGPMDFIPQYNRRLHGEEETVFLHDKLAPILQETYGIIIYQEQIMQIAGQLFGYELGEADLMRRAVSKKKQEALLAHKDIFKERGPQNDIPEDIAEKIFDEIEFFANYGFNKSHASDYAVITVQTAYLKCHYPEEYMTALLSVQFDDSTKVSTFLEECRRLNIPILPPDVNASMLDFDIEATPDGRRAIRFGLAAIKNAGSGALQHIIDERLAGGPFQSLQELCQRVDLREVGKRTLESLAKVGAMSSFGKRQALLMSLDRIMSYSIRFHKDQEVGQMTLFGDASDAGDDMLQIPDVAEARPREMLGWENELLGLYVTGRPVDHHASKLRHMNLNVVQTLLDPDSLFDGKAVQIAGEVTGFRQVFTRKNDAMAVLMIEDWHESAGSIEVVLFPRTWMEVKVNFRSMDRELNVGEIVVVRGKFERRNGTPQIVADSISTDFTVAMPDEVLPDTSPAGPMPSWAEEVYPVHYDEPNPFHDEAVVAIDTGDDVPASAASGPTEPPVNGAHHELSGSSMSWMDEADYKPVLLPDEQTTAHTVQHITVYFRRGIDADQDRRRLRRLFNIFIKYPGDDRFTIILSGSMADTPFKFPDHTTGYCEDLVKELLTVVNEQNISVDDCDDC